MFRTPKPFPATVGQFWNLKKDQNRRILVYLIHFYRIEGWAEWSTDLDNISDRDSSEPEYSYANLEDAVNNHPGRELEELAYHVGLDHDRIKDNMEKLEHSRFLGQVLSKRKQPDGPAEKKARFKMAEQPELELLPEPLGSRIPLEHLLMSSPLETRSDPKVPSERVFWKESSPSSLRIRLLARAEEERNRADAEPNLPYRGTSKDPSQRSEPSTIPLTSAERQERDETLKQRGANTGQ
jgi:hypothetical protein